MRRGVAGPFCHLRVIGKSVCDLLDLSFCLVRRHGPDGYLLVVAISGSFSFLSSPSSL